MSADDTAIWRRTETGGIQGTATISGRTHHVSGHEAGDDPRRHPASAYCRDCKSHRCEGCSAALRELGWTPPAPARYTDPKEERPK